MKLMASLFGFLALVLLGLTGCHELGHIDGPGDYGGISGNDLVGEVRNVDTRARQIELRTDAGRRELVRYDNNTRVVYRQQDYAASNLEPGDYVAVRGQQDRDGRYYTDYITVRESAQDRGGYSRPGGRFERLEGTVSSIDSRRGTFEVRNRDSRRVLVTLPFEGRFGSGRRELRQPGPLRLRSLPLKLPVIFYCGFPALANSPKTGRERRQ